MESTGGIWRCQTCETVNEQIHDLCVVCGGRRPASGQVQAQPSASADLGATQPDIGSATRSSTSPATPTGSWTTEASRERAETLQQGKPAAPRPASAKPRPATAGRPATPAPAARAPSRPVAPAGPTAQPRPPSPPPAAPGPARGPTYAPTPTPTQTPGVGWAQPPPPTPSPPTAYSPPYRSSPPYSPTPRPRGGRGTSIWVGVGICILALVILGAVANGDDSPPPQTTTAPSQDPGTSTGATQPPALPESGEESADSWIAQLQSIPTSASDATVRKALRSLERKISGVKLLRSDEFASLRSGYWVIYYPGNFADGQEAVDFCRQHGRDTRDLCVGRYLSHDPADLQQQVYP